MHVKIICLPLALALIGSAPSYADGTTKVYFETACLQSLSGTDDDVVDNGYDNETHVQEDTVIVEMELLSVREKRDGEIVDSYVQVRNCRIVPKK